MYLPTLEKKSKGREDKRKEKKEGVWRCSGGGGVVSESPPFPFPFRGPWDPYRTSVNTSCLGPKTKARGPSIAGPARGERAPKTERKDAICSLQ